LTRCTPYEGMSPQQISLFVVSKGGRPDISKISSNAPTFLIHLMKLCWDDDPNTRPSFEDIIVYLRQAIKKE
jgi:hypothetical protein